MQRGVAFQTRIVTILETNNLFITSISKYQDKTPKCRFLNLRETFIHTFTLLLQHKTQQMRGMS